MLSKSTRKWLLHIFARTPALLIFLSLTLSSYLHAQTTFKLDQVTVDLNGSPIFVDNFDNGVPPPSAPNFVTGQAASYTVGGTLTESGGKLELNILNGVPCLTPTGRPCIINSIRLLTSTNPVTARNLGPDDTFEVSGLFDLKDSAGKSILANSPPSESFRTTLNDRTQPGGPGDVTNDVPIVDIGPLSRDRPPPNAQNPNRFGCRDPITGVDVGAQFGEVVVELISPDFVLNRTDRIDCFKIDLRDDPDQIRLTLAKNNAASNVITGSFTYLKNGAEISTTVFPNTDTIFNGGTFPLTDPPPFAGTSFPAEQHTRAQFDGFIVPGAALRKFATLTTGSPVSLSQTVDTPAAFFNLQFDFLFTTVTGELTVLLDGIVLGTMPAPAVLGTDFTTTNMVVNDPGLLNRNGINLEFRLDGLTGSSVRLDNIVFPGLINGDFQTGNLTAWDTAVSGNGSVDVDIIELQPELVNGKVRLVKTTTAFSSTPCNTTPAGTFTIAGTFQNISADDLFDLVFEVKSLTGGNVLCNADGGAGGVGSTLTVPFVGGFNDGKLAPGESVDVAFQIGLATRNRFTFLVDAIGVVDD